MPCRVRVFQEHSCRSLKWKKRNDGTKGRIGYGERARIKNEEEDEEEGGYTDVFSRHRVAWPSTCTECDERSAILKESEWNERKRKKGTFYGHDRKEPLLPSRRRIVSM